MRLVKIFLFLLLFISHSLWAVIYIWQDEKARYRITDNPAQLPREFQALLEGKIEPRKEIGGVGYYRDGRGNFHFYRLGSSSSARAVPKSTKPSSPPPVLDSRWQGKPNPLVITARVKKIISGDTILLEGGQKLKYAGICFPESLKGKTKIHQEAIEYQRKLLEGKAVQILFDKKRYDEKGRLLGLVFLGKDIFVNADLVLKGYAQKHTAAPNYEYQALYQRLENYARKNKLGIWKELNKASK